MPITASPVHQGWTRKLLAAAHKGDRSIALSDTRELEAGFSGLNDHAAAGNMFTEIDPASGVCKLAKPLETDLAAGEVVRVSTLNTGRFIPSERRNMSKPPRDGSNTSASLRSLPPGRALRITTWRSGTN